MKTRLTQKEQAIANMINQPSSVTMDADRFEDQKENIAMTQNALQYTLQQAWLDQQQMMNE